MQPPLDGTVLLTGASSGIGRALAFHAAERARTLILVARRVERLEALAEELRARRSTLDVRVIPTDLSDVDQIDALCDQLDEPVDVLINNAGLGNMALIDRSDVDRVHTMLMVNIVGLTRLTQRLLPEMVRRGRGGVMNISSGFGLVWAAGYVPYAASKHYVTVFSDGLRAEVADQGVVVTQVNPGPVTTEFEEIAGAPVDRPPEFLFLSAERCAADAWRAFEKGRRMVVPGWLHSVMIRVGALLPQWTVRMSARSMAKRVRAKT